MIRISVPATSANLGAGFDSLGVALNYYNHFTMEEYDGIDISALDGVSIPTGERNLVYASAKRLYEQCGRPFRGLRLTQVNNIPLTRGLGSSSSCIVAGLMGANHLMGSPLTEEELLDIAVNMEGHPDNVAPAMLGGLVVAALEGGKVYYIKEELGSDLDFVAIIPNFELKTSEARAALPKELSLSDGVFNLSRAALMALSLSRGRYENLRVAADDRLHQPYRMKLIPHGEEVTALCNELGAYAVYISGAGSTLMALVDEKKESFSNRLRGKLDGMGLKEWQIKVFSPDNTGATIDLL